MKIRFSRHARNNMRLYKISKSDVADVIESGKHTKKEVGKLIAVKKIPSRFSGFPLKVVYEIRDEIFVITAYPLKKEFRRKMK